MKVTKHANLRIRKRCGLPRKAVEATVFKAIEYGLKMSDVSGKLRKYIDYLYFSHDKIASNIRVYGDYVYIFSNTDLITVIPLPMQYRNISRRLLKKVKSNYQDACEGGN